MLSLPDAIRAEALTKHYGEVQAVDGLSFTVPRGGTLGLLGGNGAGKTTTISMLLGLLLPSAGRITVLGHDMATDRFAALERMNFSSPYISLPARLTVRENLRVYGHLYNVRKLDRRIGELADELDLRGFLDRPAGQLSAGQKTRVALGKSLINRPDVLLLDEPTASLDPDTGDMVRTRLERYRAESGCAILLASHNMAEVERLCDTVVMLKQGRAVDGGAPADLIARYGRDDLEQVFLDIARNNAPRPADGRIKSGHDVVGKSGRDVVGESGRDVVGETTPPTSSPDLIGGSLPRQDAHPQQTLSPAK